MVDGSGAKLSVELFSAQVPEVVDGVRPQMKNVISGEGVSLFDDHDFGSEEG